MKVRWFERKGEVLLLMFCCKFLFDWGVYPRGPGQKNYQLPSTASFQIISASRNKLMCIFPAATCFHRWGINLTHNLQFGVTNFGIQNIEKISYLTSVDFNQKWEDPLILIFVCHTCYKTKVWSEKKNFLRPGRSWINQAVFHSKRNNYFEIYL